MPEERINFAYLPDPTADVDTRDQRLPDEDIGLPSGEGRVQDRPHRAQQPRRRLPESRQRPDGFLGPEDIDPVLYAPNLSIPFATNTGLDLRLTGVKVYETGVAFDLVALEPSPNSDPMSGLPFDTETINLSFRIKPDKAHRTRIQLVVSVIPAPGTGAGGAVLSNADKPAEFPDDPSEPWLAGGGGGRSRHPHSGIIETRAQYFLSPVPTAGTVRITAAYPEFGLEPASIEIDAARFLRPH